MVAATLWSPADLLVTTILVAVGVCLWFVGWYSASDKLVEGDQVVSLNVAAAGIMLAGAGLVSWFLNGRRAIRSRRRLLIERRRAQLRTEQVPESVGAVHAASLAPRSYSPVLVAGPDLRRYHREDCPLAAGRDWPAAAREQHESAGRTPCGACLP
ncbi:hypothetical protein [Sporichthya polymorpha]|uniref:hypothetical protein n=1 Tax=Sporichthya polymorpha TaxID=35751 RepID=UPI0003600172|nr:hypothetical protein [Sporichthya polymorpha]